MSIENNDDKRFFLSLAIRFRQDYETTVFQMKDIHQRIGSGDRTLNDYSKEVQQLYSYYLVHLGLND